MCGRYSFAPQPKQLHEALKDVSLPDQLEISFNIAPTQQAYVITNQAPHILQKMEWGLIPAWSADGKNSGKMINARAEGIEEKPAFRQPIHTRRCLIPADSFYEWRKEADGRKTPYRIRLKNGDLIFMAGIWDVWDKSGSEKHTFSIITTEPNQEMASLHNRMPVILTALSDRKKWLDNAPLETALTLLHPPADNILEQYPVSDRINRPGPDDPGLHERVAAPLSLF